MDEKVLRQREANKRSYEKHKVERLIKCKEFRDSKKDDLDYQQKQKEWSKRKEDKRRDDPDRILYQKNRKASPEYKEKEKLYNKSLKGKYNSYKKNASTRKIPFDLTLDKFSEYWNTSCSYCNSEIETIGIDRIDVNFGYNDTNIASCCVICNFMKNNYSLVEFESHINKILSFSGNSIEHSSPNNNYRIYKYSAKKRMLLYDLTKEDFKNITSKSCVYCGSIEKIGIDRENNDIGYTLENSVPCCKVCNIMKNKHDKIFFFEHLSKIRSHRELTNEL